MGLIRNFELIILIRQAIEMRRQLWHVKVKAEKLLKRAARKAAAKSKILKENN